MAINTSGTIQFANELGLAKPVPAEYNIRVEHGAQTELRVKPAIHHHHDWGKLGLSVTGLAFEDEADLVLVVSLPKKESTDSPTPTTPLFDKVKAAIETLAGLKNKTKPEPENQESQKPKKPESPPTNPGT